jgi:hypothetical protein
VGTALAEIREKKLYSATHATFGAYCRERWDMGRTFAHYQIEAASVVDNLKVHKCEQLPLNEAQARPLVTLDKKKQVEAWAEAVRTKPIGGMTAKHVQVAAIAVIGERGKGIKTSPPVVREMRPRQAIQPIDPRTEQITPDFKAAHENLMREIINAKAAQWSTTSKEAAAQCIKILHDIIHY